MRVLSLGWGTQSFGLAAMSALGVLPPVDVAIHADTTHERRETYDFAARWTPWLEKHGVRVVTVHTDEKRQDPFYSVNKPSTFLPAFTAYSTDVTWCPKFVCADCEEFQDNMDIPCINCGSIRVVLRSIYEQREPTPSILHRAGDPAGMLRRQCTNEWKIRPIRQWLQEHRDGQQVDQWIGISLDEAQRRFSDVQYITNTYPYLDFDIAIPATSRYGISRSDIVRWLLDNNLEVPVKSACVFCPYHNRAGWREIQLSGNGDWEKAVQVDEAIRNKRPGYVCFLTSARKPLVDCDFRSQEEHGQLSLWEAEECQGMCFL